MTVEELHKSERLVEPAHQNGWQTSIVPNFDEFTATNNPDDIRWEFYALRDKESIKAVWKGNRYQTGTYAYGAQRLYPARSGAVLKLLEGSPDASKFAGDGESDILLIRNVPWDSDEEVPAFNILVAVVNKFITWQSKRTGKTRTESCPQSSNVGKAHFRVKTTSAGRRVLEWSNEFGFQACYIEEILEIG